MLIPCELVLILERLFGYKVNGIVTPPPLCERIEIFGVALKYADKYPHLNEYISNHWNIVAKESATAYLVAAE